MQLSPFRLSPFFPCKSDSLTRYQHLFYAAVDIATLSTPRAIDNCTTTGRRWGEGRKEGRKLTAANTTPLIKSARPQQSKADSDQVSAEMPLMSTCGSEHCWHCSRAHATRLDRTKSCCVSLRHVRLDRATCECAAQPHVFVITVIPEGRWA